MFRVAATSSTRAYSSGAALQDAASRFSRGRSVTASPSRNSSGTMPKPPQSPISSHSPATGRARVTPCTRSAMAYADSPAADRFGRSSSGRPSSAARSSSSRSPYCRAILRHCRSSLPRFSSPDPGGSTFPSQPAHHTGYRRSPRSFTPHRRHGWTT